MLIIFNAYMIIHIHINGLTIFTNMIIAVQIPFQIKVTNNSVKTYVNMPISNDCDILN